MTFSRKVTAISSVVLVLSLASTIPALRKLDRLRTTATLEDVLYVSSPKTLKRLSLGYSGLLADIYWTRAVQYFGLNHARGRDGYALLAPLLEITTGLDPNLIVAYEYGANFLASPPPIGAGEPKRAIELMEFGVRNNPQEWRMYQNLGFIYYLDLKDNKAAADAFLKASKIPGAHPFLKIMAAKAAQEGGEAEMARMLWMTTYQSTNDSMIKDNAAAHLRALRVDQDTTNLEMLTSQYRQKFGHFPISFNELASAGMLRGIPVDPLGVPYKLAAGGKIELRHPDDFPFVTKGLALGYIPLKKPRILPTHE